MNQYSIYYICIKKGTACGQLDFRISAKKENVNYGKSSCRR